MSSHKTALITGATSGIGLELANLFAKDGIDLVLVARNEKDLTKIKLTLEKVYDIRVTVCAWDLAKPDAADHIYELVSSKGIDIDYLVNNAGVGDFTPFIDSDAGKNFNLMSLNMIALTELTHLFLPYMKENEFGRILNVASTAAFQPGPLMAVYYASKAYVLSFSEAIAEELVGSGVAVTALCPGPVSTNFQKAAKLGKSRLFKFAKVMDAEAVAKVGFDAMNKGKVVVIPGFSNWFFAQLPRFLPRFLVRKIILSIQKEV
jgi:uncharacterized protein